MVETICTYALGAVGLICMTIMVCIGMREK